MFPFDDVILLGYVTMTSQYSPNLHQFVPSLLCALYFIMKWTVQIIVHVTTTQLLNSEHILAANAWLLIAWNNIDGLVQEKRKSIANALELRLSCTKPLIWVCLGIWITTEKLSEMGPTQAIPGTSSYYRQVSNIQLHLSRQLNCWSLRCGWSITCRSYSNCIFILHFTCSFNILRKDNCKASRQTFVVLGLVQLILEILQ